MNELTTNWSVTLKVDTVDKIAGRLEALLTGQKYTVVESCESSGFKPRVRTSIELRPNASGKAIFVSKDDSQVGIDIVDSWGSHYFMTTDNKSKDPHCSFEGSVVTITKYASSGDKLYLVFAVE